MTTSMLIFFGAGLLLAAAAAPMMRRKVGPNPLYGLRVKATFADERVWYEANARSGRDLFVFGFAVSAMSLTLPLVPEMTEPVHAWICTAVLTVGVVVLCAVGWIRANGMGVDGRQSTVDSP